MNRLSLLFTGLAVLLVSAAASQIARGDETAQLTIHADRPTVKISPTLYGIFFEEINRAGDGGLYGEMLQNRSFEDDRSEKDKPPQHAPGWSLVLGPGAQAAMHVDQSQPLNANNPTALRIDISDAAGSRAGVANEGFHGLALAKGAVYNFSVYGRAAEGFAEPLTVSLEEKNGKVLASATLEGVGPRWKQLACTLRPNATTTHGWLVIATKAKGTIWLDEASLFPQKTFKDRPNGLRPDLAELLVDMKPAFVRFPGGCYVEGEWIRHASRWKKSIGDLAQRPGHWNLWGYRSCDGLGYHEYLQMCEDLGAEPLFVINCGMAHKDTVSLDDLGPWVQDALDAIEYANGPADSRWGSLRAKAGHPQPFHLRYMEIGNENGGPIYQDHYRVFYDAIKARYPQIKLVANTPTDQRPTEILDEHYYSSAEFFMANATRYDSYDRKGPKIYVGEYAVTSGCGRGNLRAALGEAAFMTGMERNSDVVAMSSYAPLFARPGYERWNPNAIVFDNAGAYGTPSYYVQKMFAEQRGDEVLAADCNAPPVSAVVQGGAIGVGTWNTSAEFKDVKVEQGGKTLFESNFSKDYAGWKPMDGKWSVADGALRQADIKENIRAIAGDRSWKNYTLTLKARKIAGDEGFLILFNVHNDGDKAWWNIGGWGNTEHGLEMDGVLETKVKGHIETGRWYDIKIENSHGQIRCYLDGKLIHSVRYSALPSLFVVASRAAQREDVIIKVVNPTEEPRATRIRLEGLAGKVASGTETLLTSGSYAAENSLDEPHRVVPTTTTIPDSSADFVHTFPARSVNVLRLKMAK